MSAAGGRAMKHTPGPWRVWRDMDPKEPRQIVGPSEDFICQIEESNTQDDANARLITAAPDLLAACKMMQRWIEFEHADDTEVEELTLLTVTEHVDAAIIKAEGGAQ